jgi:Mg2+ and Co2+ transporter CorA
MVALDMSRWMIVTEALGNMRDAYEDMAKSAREYGREGDEQNCSDVADEVQRIINGINSMLGIK